jgi:tetratricopeptide (TPR) repeat protein
MSEKLKGTMKVKDLPALASKQLDENASLGREAWKKGDVRSAEKYFLSAWQCIPEPKVEYDYAQSLSGGIVEFYRETGQYQKAKHWIEIMRSAYKFPEASEHSNDYVDFFAATVFYETGEFEVAFSIFDKQFKKYKARPFQGEDKKYLEFYMEESKKRLSK